MAVAAAATRARWQRSRWLALAGILSSKEVGDNGVLSGPGVAADLPVLGSTRGTTARADAEVDLASRQYLALRHQVDLEVSEARELLELATEISDTIRRSLIPPLQEAAAAARQSFEVGDAPYLFLAEANRQLVEARLRLADAEADVRRAAADLDRSVGTRVDTLRVP